MEVTIFYLIHHLRLKPLHQDEDGAPVLHACWTTCVNAAPSLCCEDQQQLFSDESGGRGLISLSAPICSHPVCVCVVRMCIQS